MPDENRPPPETSVEGAAASPADGRPRSVRAAVQDWVPPTPEEMAGLLPEYQVLSMLGRGGMGAVYLAVQLALDRPVALKVLPLEVSADPDFAERFVREARAMARLNHPNIIDVHDFGKSTAGHLFFAMEFVDGANLHQMIHGPGVEPARALEIASQLCEALAYAHDQGVIHRDVKPANVMVDQEGRVKVADFGLARLADPTGGTYESTVTGMVMGTLDYMAPEQKRGMHVDHRADIYSLGVILYEMLCREVPHGVFAPPSLRVRCDPRVDSVVTRAMQQKPELRYQTTREMQVAVEAAATPPPAFDTLAIPLPPKKLRGGIYLVLGILAVVTAVSFILPGLKAKKIAAPKAGAFEEATAWHPFVNSLGMKFVPVPITGGPSAGQRVLFSIWETRVQDYDAFVQETGRPLSPPPYALEATQPVTNTFWDDAKSFAAWLTERERSLGRIGPELLYRLPTDHEWSCAVGIGDREDPALLPVVKSDRIRGVFPWGTAWPPPPGAGNYGGEEMADNDATRTLPRISDWRDDYVFAAPVGSFAPNDFGLYDMGGNAREWCEDLYGSDSKQRVVRGGAHSSSSPATLASASRRADGSTARNLNNGFRLVLVKPPSGGAIGLRPPEPWRNALDNPTEFTLGNGAEKTGEGVRLAGSAQLTLTRGPQRDGALRTRFVFDPKQKGLQLRTRTSANHEGYALFIQDDKNAVLQYWTRNSGQKTFSRTFPLPKILQPGSEYTLEFRAVGSRLSFSLDDQAFAQQVNESGDAGAFEVISTDGQALLVKHLEYLDLDPPGSKFAVVPPAIEPSAVQNFEGHRYQFMPSAMMWSEAKEKAEAMGGHLAAINSKEEEEFIAQLCDPYLPSGFLMAWLGAIRTTEGDGWSWVTGEPFNFTAWSPDNPSSRDVGDWLVLMRIPLNKGGQLAWNDFERVTLVSNILFYLRGFVVEWDTPTN